MHTIVHFLLFSFLWLVHGQEDEVEFTLLEATIADIHDAVDAGALTYVRLTALYLARIVEYDQEHTNAVLSLNPEAVSDALAADALLEANGGKRLSPLHGIPVLLKDLIDMEGVATTAGSIAMQDCIASDDAALVKTLREAGAVILGKVNLSEFAASFGRLGFSSLGGTVLNPYDPKRSASGLSSGSAAAVAANYAVMAIGSDTAGSIRGPASSSALVGIKPTKGLVSTEGVIPYSHWTDVLGPLARTVTDAALSLAVLEQSSKTSDDSTGVQSNEWTIPTLKRGALEGITLGRIVGFDGGNAEVDALFEQAVTSLEALGATIVTLDLGSLVGDAEILGGYINGWSVLGPILGFECQDPLNEYFAAANDEGCPANLDELVQNSLPYSNTINAWNPPRLESMAACVADSPTTTDPEFIRLTTQVVPSMDETLRNVMSTNNVTGLIFPTMLCPSRITWNVEDPTWVCDTGDQWSPGYMANTMGWPEVSVPMGYTAQGAPAGLSILGLKFSDPILLGYAYDYEQETMHRRAPSGFAALAGEQFTYTVGAGGEEIMSAAVISSIQALVKMIILIDFITLAM